MHHPDLEKQLEDLRKQKQKAAEDLRDLARDALENADRASKTMMMYLQPAGLRDDCDCTGKFCMCEDAKPKPKTSRLFRKLKKSLKKSQKESDD